MTQVDYVEWVPAGKFVKIAMLATIFLIIINLALVVVFVQPLEHEDFIGIGISLTVLIFISLLFVNYRGIKIHINSERVNVRYGLLNNKNIKVEDIVSCKKVKASIGRYMGIGVRYGFDGSSAYTTSFGNAVEITPFKGRVFVFSSNNPSKICETLNK